MKKQPLTPKKQVILNALIKLDDKLWEETYDLLYHEFPSDVEQQWSEDEIYKAFQKAKTLTNKHTPRNLQRKMYDILVWGD